MSWTSVWYLLSFLIHFLVLSLHILSLLLFLVVLTVVLSSYTGRTHCELTPTIALALVLASHISHQPKLAFTHLLLRRLDATRAHKCGNASAHIQKTDVHPLTLIGDLALRLSCTRTCLVTLVHLSMFPHFLNARLTNLYSRRRSNRRPFKSYGRYGRYHFG